MPRTALALALGMLCVVAGAPPAWSQVKHERPFYGRTFLWGSGMITTPTAAMPPGKVTFAGSAGGIFLEGVGTDMKSVATVSILGLIEGGVSIYSKEDAALFGKLRVVHGSSDFPALAVGVLNVTGKEIGRFGNVDPFYDDLVDRAVGYAVATYTVEPGEDDRPIWLEFSVGWGSGFLSEDNPAFDHEMFGKGVFGSLALDFKLGRDHFLRTMLEYDSWNVNAGAMLMIGGVEVSGGVLALDGETDLEKAVRHENQLRGYLAVTVDASFFRRWPLIWKPKGI